jgi:hypothetical protein
MSGEQRHPDDDASPNDRPTRRHVLKLLGLAAATGRASAQSDGDVAVGGGGADHDFRYEGWSFAPPTIPPDGQPVGWVRRDGSAADVEVASLPTTFDANGAQWSLAGDLATAESNVTSRPAICVADDGSSILTDASLPVTWTGGGVEHVAASDLATAESNRTQRPAVLFGGDGAEVVA